MSVSPNCIYIYICLHIYICISAKKNIHCRRESQGWRPVDSPTGKLESMKGMIWNDLMCLNIHKCVVKGDAHIVFSNRDAIAILWDLKIPSFCLTCKGIIFTMAYGLDDLASKGCIRWGVNTPPSFLLGIRITAIHFLLERIPISLSLTLFQTGGVSHLHVFFDIKKHYFRDESGGLTASGWLSGKTNPCGGVGVDPVRCMVGWKGGFGWPRMWLVGLFGFFCLGTEVSFFYRFVMVTFSPV